jgi:hypothetical protein
LHAEPSVAATVLSVALALCSLRLAFSLDAISQWIRFTVLQLSLDAVSLLYILKEAEATEWAGGWTYEKEIFALLEGTLQSSIAMERNFSEQVELSHDSMRLFQSGKGIEGKARIFRTEQWHPRIKELFCEMCSLSPVTVDPYVPDL